MELINKEITWANNYIGVVVNMPAAEPERSGFESRSRYLTPVCNTAVRSGGMSEVPVDM